MPVSDLHRRVAAVALAAAAGHGFALGGGNALLAHGVISRPTLRTPACSPARSTASRLLPVSWRPRCAVRASDPSGRTRRRAGRHRPRMGEGLAEWIVTASGGEQMALQLAYSGAGRAPVIMDMGPVLDLEDVVGGKVCGLASRIEPPDCADAAAVLQRYGPAS